MKRQKCTYYLAVLTVILGVTLLLVSPATAGPATVVATGSATNCSNVCLSFTTYSIAAGDTDWHRSGGQNSILVWFAAAQAPDFCSGQGMRNQIGATFTSTVVQDQPVGLVDWRFHYRDPAAKGKPNTNCTDATDPNRNRADVCGASWSGTLRDP